MRCLITGARGFAGSWFWRQLEGTEYELVGTAHPRESLSSSGAVRSIDLTQTDQLNTLLSEVDPDVVVHLAAVSFVPQAEDDFANALATNVGALHTICSHSNVHNGAARLIFISSSEVYGHVSSEQLPIVEDTPARPANAYSLTKLMAEQLVRKYVEYDKLNAVILRSFNHIGPGQNERFVVPAFARQLAEIAQERREAVVKVGNLSARRDFSDVRDIVRAYQAAITVGEGVYNLCSGVAVSVEEVLETLIDIAGVKVTVEQDSSRMRPVDVPEFYGDNSRAKRDLNWQPRYTLRDSLEAIYRSVLD